jgi:phosphoribosyl 1,2-cyclic phosphodiesterase
LQFASLGSGSRGNATLIESGNTVVMVDCGFSLAETRRRLARLQRSIDDLAALLVTHEHGDHIRGVARLAAAAGIPVYLTHGTREACNDFIANAQIISHDIIEIDDLQVEPLPVPHDAREPVQFVFSNGDHRLGLLTDTGCSTPHIEQCLSGCDALLLECNHDVDMLMNGRYPPQLKQRVGGRQGHLSNAQAAELLQQLDTGRLQHIVAMHLSEKNNQPSLAQAALAGALSCDTDWIQVAGQDEGFDWRGLD